MASTRSIRRETSSRTCCGVRTGRPSVRTIDSGRACSAASASPIEVAAPRPDGQMCGIDTVAGEEVHHDRAGIAEPGFAEQLGGAERQQTAHARGQRAQGAGLGGELGSRLGVGRRTHDDASSVVEFGQRGVVASGGAFGEDADSDDADPGQSRGHRRG